MQNFTCNFYLKSILQQTPHIWWLSINISIIIYTIKYWLFIIDKDAIARLNNMSDTENRDRKISIFWESTRLPTKIIDYIRSTSSHVSSQIFGSFTRTRGSNLDSLSVHIYEISRHSRRMSQEINKKFIFLKSLEKYELSRVVFWVWYSLQEVSSSGD